MRDRKFNKALAILLSLAMVILSIAPMETVSAATKTQKAVNCKVCNDTKVCTYCNGTGTVELSDSISDEISSSGIKLSRYEKPESHYENIQTGSRHVHGKVIKTGLGTLGARKKQLDEALKKHEDNNSNDSGDSDKATETVECSYCKGTKKCSHCCLILTNKATGKSSSASGNNKGIDFSKGKDNNSGSTSKGKDFSNGSSNSGSTNKSNKGNSNSTNKSGKYRCSRCEDTGLCPDCDGLETCDHCYGEGSTDCDKCFNGQCSECINGYIGQWTTNGIKQRKCTRCNHGNCKYCDGTGVRDCKYCDHGECRTCNGSGNCPSCKGK